MRIDIARMRYLDIDDFDPTDSNAGAEMWEDRQKFLDALKTGCLVQPHMSCVCNRGTRSCIVIH
jgi:hypothetical protein